MKDILVLKHMDRLPQPSLWVNVHRAEVTQLPIGAKVLARSDICANHVMQVGATAFSVQFHPEVCNHTVAEWMQIPGIPEALQDLLGPQGVDSFHSSIATTCPGITGRRSSCSITGCKSFYNRSRTDNEYPGVTTYRARRSRLPQGPDGG